MKKILPILAIVVFGLALIIGSFLFLRKKSASTFPAEEQEGTLIETPLTERPYVTLVPRADGREFTLEIARIGNAKTVEYELVYLSGGLSRGAIGSVDIKGETEISRKLLLGTCSRNVCKYDEDVEEGTLTLRFRSPEGTRKFVADFHLQKGDDELTSADGRFKLESQFPSGVFYITMSTIGLPGEIEGEAVSGPYGVFTSGAEVIKGGRLSLGIPGEEVKLYSWTGKAWKELTEIEVEDQTISASVSQLATFVAVAPSVSE